MRLSDSTGSAISCTATPRALAVLVRSRSRLALGFTLIELTIVIFIIALLAGMATLGIAGLNDERALAADAREIQRMARKAWRGARGGRAAEIRFEKRAVELRIAKPPPSAAEEREGGDEPFAERPEPNPVERWAVPEETELRIRPWGARRWGKPKGQRWRFERSGLCEPLSLRVERAGRWMEMDFHPLTAEPREIREGDSPKQ